MVCMFVERVKKKTVLLLAFLFVSFFLSLTVSGWECLSLDVSLSVERCCYLLVVDCMYI